MKSIPVGIKVREGCEDLPIPSYATDGASGMDLSADVKEELTLLPGQIQLVSTGIYLSIPEGYEAQIRPRSGLALKHGVTLVNTPGTIDSDYRGLVSLIMTNIGSEPYVIRRGDRVAQMIIKEVVRAELEVRRDLDETARSAGGFGHTGTRRLPQ